MNRNSSLTSESVLKGKTGHDKKKKLSLYILLCVDNTTSSKYKIKKRYGYHIGHTIPAMRRYT